MVHACHLKSQQSTQESFAPEFLILLALKLPPCGLVVFINMNTYILYTDGTNLRTSLKESYPIGLGSYYIFTENMLTLALKVMLILHMKFQYIKHSELEIRFNE